MRFGRGEDDRTPVPGYDLLSPLPGPAGRCWIARDEASGQRVSLRLLEGPTDLLVRDAARWEVAALAAVEHEHLLPVRRLLTSTDGLVLLGDAPEGDSLVDVLAARDGLSPGEVVTLGVPLASALAALHDAGLTHGAVSAGAVWIDVSGRPLLADAGVLRLAGLLAGGAEPESAAADVRDLAAVCRAALGDDTPPALVAALEAGMAEPEDVRPTAAELSAALLEAGPPAPLRLPRAAVAPARPRPAPTAALDTPSRRRPWLFAAGVAAVLVALVLLLRSGGDTAPARPVAAAPPSATSRAPTAPTTPPPVDWAQVLGDLDRGRAAAFAAGDADALAAVYAPDAPALRRDLDLLEDLLAAHARADGLRFDVLEARPLDVGEDRAVLRVVDRLPAYRLVGDDGQLREAREGRGKQQWDVTLVRAEGRWRVSDVARAGPS